MRPIYFAQKCPQNVGNAVSETPNSKHFQGTCPRTTLEMCRHFSVIDAPPPFSSKLDPPLLFIYSSPCFVYSPLFCLSHTFTRFSVCFTSLRDEEPELGTLNIAIDIYRLCTLTLCILICVPYILFFHTFIYLLLWFQHCDVLDKESGG